MCSDASEACSRKQIWQKTSYFLIVWFQFCVHTDVPFVQQRFLCRLRITGGDFGVLGTGTVPCPGFQAAVRCWNLVNFMGHVVGSVTVLSRNLVSVGERSPYTFSVTLPHSFEHPSVAAAAASPPPPEAAGRLLLASVFAQSRVGGGCLNINRHGRQGTGSL